MTDQLSFLSQLDDTVQKGFACKGWDEAATNDCGVYVHGTHAIYSGAYNKFPNIDVKMDRVGNKVLFEFDYNTGAENNMYGCGKPLSEPCHSCHRNNSAEFVAKAIVDTFVNSVIPYDKKTIENASQPV